MYGSIRMIIGYGIDIMSTARIGATIQRFGRRFIRRIYTEGEAEFSRGRNRGALQLFTSYWAVKEATMKALGTGARRGVRFSDIEVGHQRSGKPFIRLYGAARERAEKLGVDNIAVSMSHLEDLVVAAVIFEKNHQEPST
jgi:holo-[acyl-carrier protein] synthase